MKTEQFRQGELVIQRVADDVEVGDPVPRVDGRVILAHSESGHHHFVSGKMAHLFESGELGVRICRVGGGGVTVEHGRPGGHGPLKLPEGTTYRISQKRQYEPDGGWSPVRD